jgi:hypothetical protein
MPFGRLARHHVPGAVSHVYGPAKRLWAAIKLEREPVKVRDIYKEGGIVRVKTYISYSIAIANRKSLVIRQLLVLGPIPLFIIKRLYLYS